MKKTKILVVSDTHKMHANFEKALERKSLSTICFMPEMSKEENLRLNMDPAARRTLYQETMTSMGKLRCRWKYRLEPTKFLWLTGISFMYP